MATSRRLAAIMFTDTVGYTASTQSNEATTLELLRQQVGLVRPILEAHHGREIKSTGDGFLVEFDSALKATQCAINIQRRIYERNTEVGSAPIQIRIGIHLGDVVQRDTDILGDAVNVAARIEPLAPPGGICVSGAVREQVWNKIPEKIEPLPSPALKGVQLATEIYQVILPWVGREPANVPAMANRLAVLPLTNISPDPKDEYFADGLTEELTSALSKVRELRVIARTSVGQYKATSKTVAQIGSELGVTSVLEGSVRKAGNRVRITLQLIDARSQEHLWANNYDRDLDDLFAIQSDVAEQTAGALRLELLGPERESIRKEPTTNLEAYDLYLRGNYASHLGTQGITDSVKYYESAIQRDPNFALAYAALAHAYIGLAGVSVAPREGFGRARELVLRALELDPGLSEAHAARGNLALQSEQDWALADSEFKRAISINPSSSGTRFWFGFYLYAVRRYAEAEEQFLSAIELDPMWNSPLSMLAADYARIGRLDKAIDLRERQLDRDPQNRNVRPSLGLLRLKAGFPEEAKKEAELSADASEDFARWNRAALWALLGHPQEARALVAALEEAVAVRYVNHSEIAGLYAALGDYERAMDRLELHFKDGDGLFWYSYQWMVFDPIRSDPRFQSMVDRLHLPPPPK